MRPVCNVAVWFELISVVYKALRLKGLYLWGSRHVYGVKCPEKKFKTLKRNRISVYVTDVFCFSTFAHAQFVT